MFGVLAASTVLVSGVAAADLGPAPEQAPATLASEVLLSKGRVKVGVTWRNPYTGRTGTALAMPQGDEFAYFTFSSDANPEVFVKALGSNDPNNIQLFAAGLTTFEYTVTFSGCGLTRTFVKPAYAKITYEDGAAFPTRDCQILSDPLDLTHSVTIRKDTAGKIVFAAMARDSDGRTIGTAYPYGRRAAGRAGVNEQHLTVTDFKNHLLSERLSSSTAGQIIPALGWNPSTGPTAGQCYNYTSIAPDTGGGKLQTSFSSQAASTSFSGQTDVSATLSVSYGAFKATNTFSFSESSQNSTNTGSIYFNGYALYTLNTAIATGTNVLTQQGTDALNNLDNFAVLCGGQYMTSVPAGMLATGRLSYNSQSRETTTKISDSLKASYGLQKLSAAMSSSHTSTDTSVSLDFVFEVEGGGVAASQLLTDLGTAGATYLGSCATGTTQGIADCNSFSAAADASISKAVGAFSASIPKMTDYTSFATFPRGVAGVVLPQMNAASAYSAVDFLGPYATQMNQTMTLLNQISALANRVDLYLTPAIASGSFNPAVLLDLNQYVSGNLHYTYANARNTLNSHLSACLEGSKSKTVATDCASVVNDSKFPTAYDYFGPSGPGGGDWMAQQNSIALQWAGTLACTNLPDDPWWVFPIPQDFVYVDVLPPFTNTSGSPLSGKSALVTFADQPWGDPAASGPNLYILPMTSKTDLSQIYTSSGVSKTWWITFLGNSYQNPVFWGTYIPGSITWTTSQSCKPKIDNPCVLGMTMASSTGSSDHPFSLAVDPISTFFTP